ncbi:MAG: 4-(cytidine 5'-diphospho)-2-C-methyl-D-erythritol kinase [Alphaproteobacteria bacterium]|nr:4-(cytidine 5'-diphospho)-2-C-methyl-D-erythritol kinase [Alphaproteobacteria bacterium]MCB9974635.1 4-(cytidine 5'-diphospho)-2-C-methyl-D-erythritol kinase [Rhodospirillales bacterium]
MGDSIRVFAPAKINLFLHITGKRVDGYHLLDSLVAFADIGDVVDIGFCQGLSFSVTGPFSDSFSKGELDSSGQSHNIVVRAARALAQAAGKEPNVRIHLEKNLPLASGIGGGSTDAAAVIRGMLELWKVEAIPEYLPSLLARLGADMPVCWRAKAAQVKGVGEILEKVPRLPDIPVVLVNPLVPCITADVFREFDGDYEKAVTLPERFTSVRHVSAFLAETRNSLLEASLRVVPGISDCLHVLGEQEGCLVNRVSGSGATCFGLFENAREARAAAANISEKRPSWWVKTGTIIS